MSVYDFQMSIINKIGRRVRRVFPTADFKKSYAQCGEDLIVHYLFHWIGIAKPSYLDLGAHHPTYLSNTYHFYLQHSYGVCVEPDPAYFSGFQKKRGRDICLNVGVGTTTSTEADFFLMSAPTLNTFSEEEAKRFEAETSYKILKQIKMPIIAINEIVEKYFLDGPNFVSLDIEGLDLAILQAFDFTRWRPQVFCVETVVFSEQRSGATKVTDVIKFMQEQGYFVYADTYINTIFVDQSAWQDESSQKGDL